MKKPLAFAAALIGAAALAQTQPTADGGWHTTYQVTSEEMFAMWAASTGTSQLARQPGDPLPRLVLDGVAVAKFEAGGLCRDFRIWWHSVVAS